MRKVLKYSLIGLMIASCSDKKENHSDHQSGLDSTVDQREIPVWEKTSGSNQIPSLSTSDSLKKASINEVAEQLYLEIKEKSGLEKAMTEADLAIYYIQCCPDSVIKYSKILDQYNNRFNDRALNALKYRIKAYIADNQLNLDSALYFDKKSLDLFREEGDTLQMGWVTSHIGYTYFLQGNYELASDRYMQALSYFEGVNNKEGIAFALNGLGNSCYYVEKFDLALEYYESSLEVYNELGMDSYKIKIHNNLASIQYGKKNYSRALDNFLLAAEGFEKIRDYRSLSVVLSNISLCYYYLNENRKATEYVRRALDIAIRENDISSIIIAKLNFGFYLSTEGNFNEAARYLQEGMDLSKEYGLRPMEEQIYVEFAEMYALSGDFEKAYYHRLKYDTLHFETISQETQQQLDKLNLAYKTRLKENEINQLRADKVIQKKKNTIYLVLIGSFTLMLILLFYGYHVKRKLTTILKKQNQQLNEYNERLQQNEHELRDIIEAKNKLFSVVAHDLKNPVATLRGFSELLLDNIHDLEKQTIEDYTRQIYKDAFRTYALLENLLLWAQSQMQVLKVNISTVRIYDIIKDSMFTISASLSSKNIDFELNCDEELIAAADIEMIKVVIRNLLSNAVKFTYPGGKVTVNAFRDTHSAVIEVSDTGVGMDEKTIQEIFTSNLAISSIGTAGETGSGLGLMLSKEYIEKNNGSLTVESELDVGTTFRLTLPVKSPTN